MDKRRSLAPAAQAALRQSPFPALRSVEVYEHDGCIVLCGKVSRYYLKQLAQEAVLRVVEAAVPVDNRLEVEKKSRPSEKRSRVSSVGYS